MDLVQMRFKELDDRFLWGGPHVLRHFLPILEEQQRRNAHDAVLRCQFTQLVDVESCYGQSTVVFIGDLLQHRLNHFTGCAPFGPEVDDDRNLCIEHAFLKVVLGDFEFHTCTVRKPA